MSSHVSQRLMIAIEKRRGQRAEAQRQLHPWLEETWKRFTIDLGSWLIAHGPRHIASSAPSDRVELASQDSFPASDPPGWIDSRHSHER